MSVTGIRLWCIHRFKIPLSVGDFALVLTCEKGRFTDIHRHRFVDIWHVWCWPYPGQVVMGLLKNTQFHWCKFAKWPSIILWVALENIYSYIWVRGNTFSKCVTNVCTLKGCSSTPVCIILFCNISVWWVLDKPADNTSLPRVPQHTAPSCQVRLCWQNTAASHGHRRTRLTAKIPARIMKYSSNWNKIWNVET